MTGETILTNARVVTRHEAFVGTVVLSDGAIASVDEGRSGLAAAQDLGGDFLIPGLVELHTDNLERHFTPRPGVLWPSPLSAVMTHDAQIAGAGITTVLDAICVGTYRESPERRHILEASVETVRKAREEDLLRADHFIHLRCEVADPDVVAMFEPYQDDPLLRLVSVMDHTPGQRQWQDIEQFRRFYRSRRWSEEEMDARVAGLVEDSERYSAPHRQAIVARCRERGLPLASHDDTTEAHVAHAVEDGIAIAEFPTTREAAAAARRGGLGTILGAPNIVRGGSHSGNASALDLAEDGLVDALSSDYVPASLLHAAFLMAGKAGIALPDAIACVTATTAEMAGFHDRGRIEAGARGDLVRIRMVDNLPVVRAVWRQGRKVL